jgi:hypothetical protein
MGTDREFILADKNGAKYFFRERHRIYLFSAVVALLVVVVVVVAVVLGPYSEMGRNLRLSLIQCG